MFKKLFEPITIGNLKLKNRLIVAPMVTNYCNQDGTVTERFIKYHETRAKGGWGLITIEQTVISKSGKGHPCQPGLWADEHIDGLSRLTERVHAAGGMIAVQINHAGRSTRSSITGTQPVAPSTLKDPILPEIPRELTIREIHQIIEQFGDAALRAKKAGFDMVVEHAHARYLIANFLSPISNKRTDQYGGSLINRARFAVEVLKNMRDKVGPNFPIMYRFSADELMEGGLSINDTVAIAQLVEQAGANALDVSVGNTYTSRYITQPSIVAHAFISDIAQQIKNAVSIPVAVAGRINDPLIAESLLTTGKADLISMGRASLADPEFPNKVRENRLDDILYCIGCLEGCVGNVRNYRDVTCLVNPLTGREEEYNIKEAEIKKKVIIAGGGPAGMEAAIVAAQRGHNVSLYEKTDKLGGQWLLAAIPPGKTEFNTLTIWQKKKLNDLGVRIFLKTSVTPELIENEKPDVVIVATGANPIVPEIEGVNNNEKVVQAFDILSSKVNVGNKVVIIGGGLVGCETAYHLSLHGKEVFLIEMLDAIAKNGQPSANYFLFKSLEQNKVNIITSAKVIKIKARSLVYQKDNQTYEIGNIDNIILAIGAKPVNTLSEKLKSKVNEIMVIGDAKQVRKAIDAVQEGFYAGLMA